MNRIAIKQIIALPILLIVFLLSACSNRKIAASPVSVETAPLIQQETKEIILSKRPNENSTSEYSTRIDSLTIQGDILSVFIAYGGGCKIHEFDLYAVSGPNSTVVPEALFLRHQNNGDQCRKLIMKELKFNIAKIKPGSLQIQLSLGGHIINYN
jgi:hypothetical protein